MKVLQVSTENNSGGASRSAYRLHQTLLEQNIDSSMRVLTHQTANSRVISGRAPRTYTQKIKDKTSQLLWRYSTRNWRTDNPILHSFGRDSAGIVDELNQSSADVLNLHWIPKLLSIQDVGALRKPIVWTVHDMWPFCGAEHVTPDVPDARFRQGYLPNNRPESERGPDLNMQTWLLKRNAWSKQQFKFVCPSKWMASCVAQSVLFGDLKMSIDVIPNPLDTIHTWRPIDKDIARRKIGLDPHRRYVIAGSGGGMPTIKGDDLLPELMTRLNSQRSDPVELIIFGRYGAATHERWGCRVHWMGPVQDDAVMATLYSAGDVMIVPSRQDNLPNTAIEAMACGTPVVAFNLGGLPDIVDHGRSGWLAVPTDLEGLSKGITWLLSDGHRLNDMSVAARDSAVKKFSAAIVAERYLSVYADAIASRHS